VFGTSPDTINLIGQASRNEKRNAAVLWYFLHLRPNETLQTHQKADHGDHFLLGMMLNSTWEGGIGWVSKKACFCALVYICIYVRVKSMERH
jgi:hypothetical protein